MFGRIILAGLKKVLRNTADTNITNLTGRMLDNPAEGLPKRNGRRTTNTTEDVKMIDIKLPIKPFPKDRPRFTMDGHAYTTSRTRKGERDIKLLVKAEMARNGLIMSEGPIVMQLEFCFEGEKPFHIVGPDTDNLCKSVLDSCQGVIYKNDSQVITLEASKVYGKENYIHIKAKETK